MFGKSGNDFSWLLAHELGHGVFTLKHLNDANYAGKNSLGSIKNLMDYTKSTDLAAFQWNIMANPAVLTGLDGDDDSKAPKLTTADQDINRFFNLYKCALSTGGSFDFPKIMSGYGHSGTLLVNGTKISLTLLLERDFVDYKPTSNSSYTLKRRDDAQEWMDYGHFYIKTNKEYYKTVSDYLNSKSLNSNKAAIEKYSKDKDFKSLYQYDVCSFKSISVDVRLSILGSIGSQFVNFDHQDHVAIAILKSLIEDDFGALYKWLREHSKEVISLYDGVDDENTKERFIEYVMLCTYKYFSNNATVAASTKADRTYIFDKNKKHTLTFGYKDAYLSITETKTGVGNTKQHLDVNPMEPVKVQAINSAGNSTDKSYEMYIPAIYLKYLVEKANDEDLIQFVNGTVTIAGVYSGAGLLIRGGSTILKVIGAVELINSATNVLLFSDAVQNQLKQTDYGRKFLELWPKISTATDVATIFTFYATTKLSLNRINTLATTAEKAAINSKIATLEQIIDNLDDVAFRRLATDATHNASSNKVMLGRNVENSGA